MIRVNQGSVLFFPAAITSRSYYCDWHAKQKHANAEQSNFPILHALDCREKEKEQKFFSAVNENISSYVDAEQCFYTLVDTDLRQLSFGDSPKAHLNMLKKWNWVDKSLGEFRTNLREKAGPLYENNA